MKRCIQLPGSEGVTSRQAHCDLPEGTYEREMGREGFFGPPTHLPGEPPPRGRLPRTWGAREGAPRLRRKGWATHNLDGRRRWPKSCCR
jgi:homogentisate 1,2-dioxygenase